MSDGTAEQIGQRERQITGDSTIKQLNMYWVIRRASCVVRRVTSDAAPASELGFQAAVPKGISSIPSSELRRVGNRSPEILPMYSSVCGGVQLQLRPGSLRHPQGHGLAAATS
jgi:hypothetical protein